MNTDVNGMSHDTSSCMSPEIFVDRSSIHDYTPMIPGLQSLQASGEIKQIKKKRRRRISSTSGISKVTDSYIGNGVLGGQFI